MKTQDLKTTKNGIVLGGYFYNDELGLAFPATRGSFGYKAEEWQANECDARFRNLKANAPKGRNGKWSYSLKQCESLGYHLEINRTISK